MRGTFGNGGGNGWYRGMSAANDGNRFNCTRASMYTLDCLGRSSRESRSWSAFDNKNTRTQFAPGDYLRQREQCVSRLVRQNAVRHLYQRNASIRANVDQIPPPGVACQEIDRGAAYRFHAVIGDDDDNRPLPVSLEGIGNLTDEGVSFRVGAQCCWVVGAIVMSPCVRLIEVSEQEGQVSVLSGGQQRFSHRGVPGVARGTSHCAGWQGTTRRPDVCGDISAHDRDKMLVAANGRGSDRRRT
jgi:hypothetical protein